MRVGRRCNGLQNPNFKPALTTGAAQAQCVNKTASGSGTTDNKATFQAWETVLQQVDMETWSVWMTSPDQPLGKAPGWSVKD